MKSYKIILLTLLWFSVFNMAYADEVQPDYPVFTDIIHEWSSSGKIMQLGDHTIGTINSVWLDRGQYDVNGEKVLTKANTAYIKNGQPATAVIKGKDKTGLLIAHKIIIFSGKGLKNAVEKLSPSQREEYSSYLD
ncbi:MAG: hypothetical protein MI892_02005 [Desulfobacterales bacterium]|nr:hypothetical protein [Desulfobacterales bacterium]